MKNKITIGILAHVDSGKTTLSEAMLYLSGSIRKLGRVDHKDTFLDNSDVERERGITVFSKQADIDIGEVTFTLLDTPGHVDFSAEAERTLQVLDYAILVISGTDGVQSHVYTLWRLLKIYNIPTLIFVNKMDQEGNDASAIMEEIKDRLGDECVDFSEPACGSFDEDFYEEAATCDEDALDEFLSEGHVSDDRIKQMIADRKIFPCFFGSALRLTGVEYFMGELGRLAMVPVRDSSPSEFGARVYKISHDSKGNRLTHMKVVGGRIFPKMIINEEKVNQIRYYSGESFISINEAYAGDVCVVTGLNNTFAGQGLGNISGETMPILEPVMVYSLLLPAEVNVSDFYSKIKIIEEENPELHIEWNEGAGKINVKLMGEIQTEILKRMIRERFDVDVEFGKGSIVYKETVAESVVGVGHYEPLRHYAEVHVVIEPAERGTGIRISSECSEEILAKNWQRLIMTHIGEKKHAGVLTGSELTDVHIKLVSGRAHLKHTEGGDFREATYRAIRQGLMKAGNVLLEPFYSFSLEVPQAYVGRAMTDIQKMSGTFDGPEISSYGNTAVICGSAPVSGMQGYQSEVAAYTKGLGRLTCTLKGYERCHNAEEVIEKTGYYALGDTANQSGSIFCSHGAGFYVGPYEVEDYMHLPLVPDEYRKKYGDDGMNDIDEEAGEAFFVKQNTVVGSSDNPENYQAVSFHGLVDKELEGIFVKTYGPIKHKKATEGTRMIDYDHADGETAGSKITGDGWTGTAEPDRRSHEAKRRAKEEQKESYLLVDGYNIINAWPELKALAAENLESARIRLLDIMCNYQGFKKMILIVVFDAYRVPGRKRDVSEYNNIYVVYTKEAETADQYIEKTVHKLGKHHNVTVATSDALEQIIIFGEGAVRLSAAGLLDEIRHAEKEIRDAIGEF